MKVRELIELLEDQDPEAEVLLLSQPHWPFEYSIRGVTSRDEIHEEDEDRDDEGDEDDRDDDRDGALTDVFLLEGSQLRYGSKRAWDR
jgi:hypothetical protein